MNNRGKCFLFKGALQWHLSVASGAWQARCWGRAQAGWDRAGWSWGIELLCQQHTRVLHSGSQVCSWAKQLSFKEQQMVCCRADGTES